MTVVAAITAVDRAIAIAANLERACAAAHGRPSGHPHLRLVCGRWVCGSMIHTSSRGALIIGTRCGYGVTPREAYDDWFECISRWPG